MGGSLLHPTILHAVLCHPAATTWVEHSWPYFRIPTLQLDGGTFQHSSWMVEHSNAAVGQWNIRTLQLNSGRSYPAGTCIHIRLVEGCSTDRLFTIACLVNCGYRTHTLSCAWRKGQCSCWSVNSHLGSTINPLHQV